MAHPQKTVIFSAPSGWGKSTRSAQLRKEFGCSKVVEEWSPRAHVQAGALHLTNAPPHSLHALHDLPGVQVVTRGW